jgi:hypothetical protein
MENSKFGLMGSLTKSDVKSDSNYGEVLKKN